MVDAATKIVVRDRAGNRCEYCRLSADVLQRPMHVEHIIALQHRGTDALENLALACDRCNLHKGPNIATLNPDGLGLVQLFHPRRDRWMEHFAFDGADIVGLTPTGRATVFLLEMNHPARVRIRELLVRLGTWPPN